MTGIYSWHIFDLNYFDSSELYGIYLRIIDKFSQIVKTSMAAVQSIIIGRRIIHCIL